MLHSFAWILTAAAALCAFAEVLFSGTNEKMANSTLAIAVTCGILGLLAVYSATPAKNDGQVVITVINIVAIATAVFSHHWGEKAQKSAAEMEEMFKAYAKSRKEAKD